jgi:hypothetical protein
MGSLIQSAMKSGQRHICNLLAWLVFGAFEVYCLLTDWMYRKPTDG